MIVCFQPPTSERTRKGGGRRLFGAIGIRAPSIGVLGMRMGRRRPSWARVGVRLRRLRRLRRLAALLVWWVGAALLAGCAGGPGAGAPVTGHVLAVGSTALQPLVTKAAQLFNQQHAGAQVEVQGGGSLAGLGAVTSQKADIGDSDVYADPATYPDPTLTDHLVCVVPFVMIANQDVTLPSLSRDGIIKIFSTGEITNWKQVGGPDLAIVPVVRPPTSGTRATFRKYVLDGRDQSGKVLTSDSSSTVLTTVAGTPGAIGYLAVPVLDNIVRTIAIDGQTPTLENIEAGRYSFWSFEHMYTVGDTTPATEAFLDFMLTGDVQQVAQQMGYIPIATMKLVPESVPTASPSALRGAPSGATAA
jgi:phosphate transport system substrate-binding protein